MLSWTPPGPGNICKNNLCWNQFERPLTVGLFFENNLQFLNNLQEYHWVKFNYIAVKVRELSYYGITTTDTNAEGQPTGVSGITALNLQHLPMYFMWDLEQDMSFTEGTHLKVNAEQLSQYQFSKRLYPTSRKGVTFLWRFPKTWRQYVACYRVRNSQSNTYWTNFMYGLFGIQGLRAPNRLLGAHQNIFFDLSIPTDPAYGVKGRTVIGYNFYLGVSFKGRQLMGTLNTFSEPKIEDQNEDQKLDV